MKDSVPLLLQSVALIGKVPSPFDAKHIQRTFCLTFDLAPTQQEIVIYNHTSNAFR